MSAEVALVKWGISHLPVLRHVVVFLVAYKDRHSRMIVADGSSFRHKSKFGRSCEFRVSSDAKLVGELDGASWQPAVGAGQLGLFHLQKAFPHIFRRFRKLYASLRCYVVV